MSDSFSLQVDFVLLIVSLENATWDPQIKLCLFMPPKSPVMKILPFVIYLLVLWRSRPKSILLIPAAPARAGSGSLKKHCCFSVEETKTEISQAASLFSPLSANSLYMLYAYCWDAQRICERWVLKYWKSKGSDVITHCSALIYVLTILVAEQAEDENRKGWGQPDHNCRASI